MNSGTDAKYDSFADGYDPKNWICPDCINYQGGVHCKGNVYIPFTFANMSRCVLFEKGIRCQQCGLITKAGHE